MFCFTNILISGCVMTARSQNIFCLGLVRWSEIHRGFVEGKHDERKPENKAGGVELWRAGDCLEGNMSENCQRKWSRKQPIIDLKQTLIPCYDRILHLSCLGGVRKMMLDGFVW